MTAASTAPVLDAADLETALDALRAQGLRVSSARRQVIETLYAAAGPVSAEAVAGGLGTGRPPLDLASVYRNLETLERVGLVRHVHLGHGPGLYTIAGGEEREYLICEGCSSVRAVERSELDHVRAAIRSSHGFEARFGHFPIAGLCAACLTERP